MLASDPGHFVQLTCFFDVLAAEPRANDVRVRLAPENFMHLMSLPTVEEHCASLGQESLSSYGDRLSFSIAVWGSG